MVGDIMKKKYFLIITGLLFSFFADLQAKIKPEVESRYAFKREKFIYDLENYQEKLIDYYVVKYQNSDIPINFQKLIQEDQFKKTSDFILDELNELMSLDGNVYKKDTIKILQHMDMIDNFAEYLPAKERIEYYKAIITVYNRKDGIDRNFFEYFRNKYSYLLIQYLKKHYLKENRADLFNTSYNFLQRQNLPLFSELPFYLKYIQILNKSENRHFYKKQTTKQLIGKVKKTISQYTKDEISYFHEYQYQLKDVYETLFYECISSSSPDLILWGLRKLIISNHEFCYSKSFDYSVDEVDLIIKKSFKMTQNYSEKYALKSELEQLTKLLPDNYHNIIEKNYLKYFGINLKHTTILNDKKVAKLNRTDDEKWNAKSFEVGENISYLTGFHANFIAPVSSSKNYLYLIEHSRIKTTTPKSETLPLINVNQGTIIEKCNYYTRLIKIDPLKGQITYGKKFRIPHSMFFSKNFQYFHGENLVVFSKAGFIYYNLNLADVTLEKAPFFYLTQYQMVVNNNKLYIFKQSPFPQKLLCYDLLKRKYKKLYEQSFKLSLSKNANQLFKFRGLDKSKKYLLFNGVYRTPFIYAFATDKFDAITYSEYKNMTSYNEQKFYNKYHTTSNSTYNFRLHKNLNPNFFTNYWMKRKIRYSDKKKPTLLEFFSEKDSPHILGVIINRNKPKNNLQNMLFFITKRDKCPKNKILPKVEELIAAYWVLLKKIF